MTHWRRRLARALALALGVAALLLAGPLFMLASGTVAVDHEWHQANRDSAALAPDPKTHPDAVVQVYAARAFHWRGAFAVHSWIAVKEADAARYHVYDVTGWRGGRVARARDLPDRNWFGNRPRLLADVRGAAAEALVAPIADAAARYPFDGDYRVWPGPNSNTFVAWMLREVEGLDAALPATAIGKDYLPGAWFARMPSGTGYQVSLRGLMGLGIARSEGLEVNVLGLVIGLDPLGLAVKLPGVGHIGLRERPVTPRR